MNEVNYCKGEEDKSIEEVDESNSFAIIISVIFGIFFSVIIFISVLLSNNFFEVIINTQDINKPIFDEKSYSVIKLNNNLIVTLISDPNNIIASAALSVKAGSLNEPDSIPGLAHLVEHMLFLGNSIFPVNELLDSYLSLNLGNSNAFTDDEKINFYFEIENSKLEHAVNRFSAMFYEPLFDLEMIDKEINAVNSENINDSYQINRKNDLVFRELGNKPFNRFSCGSEEIFRNFDLEELQSQMFKYFKKYFYTSSMRLTIISGKEMPSLIYLVNKYFSKLKDKKSDYAYDNSNSNNNGFPSYLKRTFKDNSKDNKLKSADKQIKQERTNTFNSFQSPSFLQTRIQATNNNINHNAKNNNLFSLLPEYIQFPKHSYKSNKKATIPYFYKNQLSKLIYISTESNHQIINFKFILKPNKNYYKIKPLEYLLYFLNNRNKSSLYYVLKEKSLITNIKANVSYSLKEISVFEIDINLTNKGYYNPILIVDIVLNYLDYLKKNISQVGLATYEELDVINYNNFKFRDEMKSYTDMIVDLSYNMFDIDMRSILNYNYVFGEFNEDIIRKFLGDLNRDNVLVFLTGKIFPSHIKEFDKASKNTEKWYSTDYYVINLSDIKLENYTNSVSDEHEANKISKNNSILVNTEKDNSKIKFRNFNNDIRNIRYASDNKLITKDDKYITHSNKIRLKRSNKIKENERFKNHFPNNLIGNNVRKVTTSRSKKSDQLYYSHTNSTDRLNLANSIIIQDNNDNITNKSNSHNNTDSNSNNTDEFYNKYGFDLKPKNEFSIFQPLILDCDLILLHKNEIEFTKEHFINYNNDINSSNLTLKSNRVSNNNINKNKDYKNNRLIYRSLSDFNVFDNKQYTDVLINKINNNNYIKPNLSKINKYNYNKNSDINKKSSSNDISPKKLKTLYTENYFISNILETNKDFISLKIENKDILIRDQNNNNDSKINYDSFSTNYCFDSKRLNQTNPTLTFSSENHIIFAYPTIEFKIPKAYLTINMLTTKVFETNKYYLSFIILTQIIRNKIDLELNDYLDAGNSFKFEVDNGQLNISLYCFSNTLSLAFSKIVKAFLNINDYLTEVDYYNIYYDGVIKELFDKKIEDNPLLRVENYINNIIRNKYVLEEELINYLENESLIESNKTSNSDIIRSNLTYNTSENINNTDIKNINLNSNVLLLKYSEFVDNTIELLINIKTKTLISGLLIEHQLVDINNNIKEFLNKLNNYNKDYISDSKHSRDYYYRKNIINDNKDNKYYHLSPSNYIKNTEFIKDERKIKENNNENYTNRGNISNYNNTDDNNSTNRNITNDTNDTFSFGNFNVSIPLILQTQVIKESEMLSSIIPQNAQNISVFSKTNDNKNEMNNALVSYYFMDTNSTKNKVLSQLINLYFGNAFYDYLRTEKQYGYISNSELKDLTDNTTAFIYYVQGSVASNTEVDLESEKLIFHYKKLIENISKSEFDELIKNLKMTFSDKDNNLISKTDYLWREIQNNKFEFDLRKLLKLEIEKITKQELIDFYNEVFVKNPSKISFRMNSQISLGSNVIASGNKSNNINSIDSIDKESNGESSKNANNSKDYYLLNDSIIIQYFDLDDNDNSEEKNILKKK